MDGFFMFVMVLNIFFNQLFGYFISNSSYKIPVFPKLTAPQLTLHFGKLLKDLACRYAFKILDNLGYRISWWESQKYVNMILGYFHRFNFQIVNSGYTIKAISDEISEITPKYPFAIFRGPNQVVASVVYSMAGSFDRHAVIVNNISGL